MVLLLGLDKLTHIAITPFVSIYNGYIHAQNKSASSETFNMHSKMYTTGVVYMYKRTNLVTYMPIFFFFFFYILAPKEL